LETESDRILQLVIQIIDVWMLHYYRTQKGLCYVDLLVLNFSSM